MSLDSPSTSAATPGKHVGGDTYVHREALPYLDSEAVRRIERAEELAAPVQWNVAKWSKRRPLVSLLDYPAFFEQPFPRLAASVTVDLENGEVRHRRYDGQRNPPILHRKELLLPLEHPRYEAFRRLTEQLDAAGLLRGGGAIGWEQRWLERLTAAGYSLNDHTLTPDPLAGEAPTTEAVQASAQPPVIERHKTAIRRTQLSAPLQALHRHAYLDGSRHLLDYGCGQGDDLRVLQHHGITASGWDPYYCPEAACDPADIVNLGFVINVIEDPEERAEVLRRAFFYAQELLVVAVMLGTPDSERWQPWGDGVLTQRGTFQKYFTQAELSQLLSETLDVEPVPVGPGLFFAFRRETDAQRFREQRAQGRTGRPPAPWQAPETAARRSARDRFYERHRELLEALWAEYRQLGRRPRTDEVTDRAAIESACGSLGRALRFLERYHGTEPIEEAAQQRREDLQVFLAMELFRHRKPSGYSAPMHRDFRAFFGSQQAALGEAQRLLRSLADPQALYRACCDAVERGLGYLHEERAYVVHSDYMGQLPAELRAYIGCATHLYGDPSAADLIKVHIGSAKLSLMRYDDFEGQPLPRLLERIKLNFRTQDFEVFRYGEAFEPPYLYIKSRYIGEGFPHLEAQQAFDEQLLGMAWLDFEDRLGPPKARLDEELRLRWLTVDGFSLVPIPQRPPLDQRCGAHLTFRDLIECGETQQATGIANIPEKPETYTALAYLTREVLDPVMDYFGGIELTYGFAGAALARAVPGRNDPKRDQHASYERNTRGNRVCPRGGAAVDFLVPDESMAEVACWVAEHTPFDRLYYYGDDRPVHVSIGPEQHREIVHMRTSENGRRLPRVIKEPRQLLSLAS